MFSRIISTLSTYKRLTLIFIFGIGIALSLGAHFLREQINAYALSSTQDLLGNRFLAPEQEQTIRAIAQRMNITQKFHIRRMNSAALTQFGYHNAFAYWPQGLGFIPLGNEAFMYVSEGFFEDLSPEEQEFLIGHELTHIQEQHMRYLQLLVIFLIIFITINAIYLRRHLKNYFAQYISVVYSKFMATCFAVIVWAISFFLADLSGSAYQRHMEWVADFHSFQKLGSYDGFLKLSDRWLREYKMQLHNNYGGIFSDHPSVAERKQYCLALQKQNRKDIPDEN